MLNSKVNHFEIQFETFAIQLAKFFHKKKLSAIAFRLVGDF